MVLYLCADMFLANQIAGFFNQLFLWSKVMKQIDFSHVNTNARKFKVNFYGGRVE